MHTGSLQRHTPNPINWRVSATALCSWNFRTPSGFISIHICVLPAYVSLLMPLLPLCYCVHTNTLPFSIDTYIHWLAGTCVWNSSICLSCFGLTCFSLNYAFNSNEHNWQPKTKFPTRFACIYFSSNLFFVFWNRWNHWDFVRRSWAASIFGVNWSSNFSDVRVAVSFLNEKFHHPSLVP